MYDIINKSSFIVFIISFIISHYVKLINKGWIIEGYTDMDPEFRLASMKFNVLKSDVMNGIMFYLSALYSILLCVSIFYTQNEYICGILLTINLLYINCIHKSYKYIINANNIFKSKVHISVKFMPIDNKNNTPSTEPKNNEDQQGEKDDSN